MPALPKSIHFDIADACRDIPESHGRITLSCNGAWQRRTDGISDGERLRNERRSKRFRDRDIDATNGAGLPAAAVLTRAL